MKLKRILSVILLLLLLVTAWPFQAFAAATVTAEIPFTIKNAPGTVKITAENGGPLPGETEITGEGDYTFKITYDEPGTYIYTVAQKNTGEDYDPTEYTVTAYVTIDANGELHCAVYVSVGTAFKPENIIFENNSTGQPGQPSLEVIKTAKRDGQTVTDVLSGDEVTYEITVTNTGSAPAQNVIITDTLPKETPALAVKEIKNGGKLSDDEKTITWLIPSIAAGESVTVSFAVTVPEVSKTVTWKNIATADWDDRDKTDPPPSGEAEITETVGVSISKLQQLGDGERTVNTIYVQPGDTITYYVTVTNNSGKAIENLVVKDEVPLVDWENEPRLELIETSISHNGTVGEDHVITWNLGTLGDQEAVTVTFQAIVPDVSAETHWFNRAEGKYDKNSLIRLLANLFGGDPDLTTNEVEAVYEPESTPPGPGTDPTSSPEPSASPSPGSSTSPAPDTSPEPSITPGTSASPDPSASPAPAGSSEPGTSPDPSSAPANGPQTGDESQLDIWLAVMIGSLIGLIIVFLTGRKRRDKRV